MADNTTYTACIWVGGSSSSLTALPAPTEMTQSFQDMDASSTTRNAQGTMVRSVVRGGTNAIRKIELKWACQPVSSVQSVLNLIKQSSFYVKYWDCMSNSFRTAKMYCGDRKVSIKRIAETGEPFIKELSFNLIEY